MKKELEEKLFSRYPKIFRQKDLPVNQTAMCWGIETGDGWYWLIDKLCCAIQFLIDSNKVKTIPQVEAIQVKEKFGGLRFYYSGGDNRIGDIVDFVASLSYHICEVCGSTGDDVSQSKDGWITTLCNKCRGDKNE